MTTENVQNDEDFGSRHALLRLNFSEVNFEKIKRAFPNLDRSISALESIQGHVYRDRRLAAVALIHRSALVYWPSDKSGVCSNERLEFLGDAYLSFFVATEAMIAHPDLQEGQLSKLRAAIVGTENLASKARMLKLGEVLLFGKGEISSTGQRKMNALADAFESVTAALLLDAGEPAARSWLSHVFAADFVLGKETLDSFDVKTRFQQWTQGILGVPPTYRVVGNESTPQQTLFVVAGFIGNVELARAKAPNKRDASKLVAAKMQAMVDIGALTPELVKEYYGKPV